MPKPVLGAVMQNLRRIEVGPDKQNGEKGTRLWAA